MDQELTRSLLGSKLRIRSSGPFFSVLVGHLRPVQSETVPTASTDSKHLFICKDFWMRLKPAERDFVLVHEVLHAALGHCHRGRGRQPIRWNIACDYVVNLVAKDAGYSVVQGCLLDEKYRGLTVEEVYALVPECCADFFLSGDVQPLAGDGDSEAAAKAEAAKWRSALARARAAEKAYGSSPVGELLKFHEEASRVDWRSALWRMFDGDADFGDWDRRLVWSETYVEDLVAVPDGAGMCALCVDTSGSTMDVLGQFVGEVREAAALCCRPFPLYYADAELIGPLEIDELDRPRGGGGTSFVPFFDEVARKNYRRVVYLTDLCGSFPEKTDADVLWVVPPGIYADPPFGRVVKVV
jgi:predicted metal-dependent peptidase